MVYKHLVRQILHLLFPPRCLITDQIIKRHRENPFISSIASEFLPLLDTPCHRCGLPLAKQSTSQCGHCQKKPPVFDNVISPLLYIDPISSMIRDLKFHHKLHYAAFFANQIKSKVIKRNQDLPQLIIPMPLHKKRLYQRGYNQAREVSRLLAKQLSIPHDDQSLIRIKATQEQSGLDAKQRRSNLKNAFALENSLAHINHVAIVDDVMTTGATANSVAITLKQEGIEQVDIWVMARTPK